RDFHVTGVQTCALPIFQKTSELVQEIAAASSEQSAGVGQINGAIEQLNQLTQQNASAAEELAATAEELSGQAEQLQQLIAFFRLAGEAGPALAASRRHEQNAGAAADSAPAGAAAKVDESACVRF